MTSEFCYGFRIVGSTREPRRLIDPAAAFRAYADCDPRAECHREAYLSAFQFGPDFREHLEQTRSTAGFSGPCWAPWLWFDIDNEAIEQAQADAQALVETLCGRYALDAAALLLFFSGAKGFHVGLPTSTWAPDGSTSFHRACRRLAETLADAAGVEIDTGVYDRVRAFRAPNSKHPKTGLHKRRLSVDELNGATAAILDAAKEPAAFALPPAPPRNGKAAADWSAAVERVRREAEAKAQRRATGAASLNRGTLDFIRDGAATGDRHRLLFSAAANLAEFGCSSELAHALLTEAGRDSGLPPSEVRRQIDCGLGAVDPGVETKVGHAENAGPDCEATSEATPRAVGDAEAAGTPKAATGGPGASAGARNENPKPPTAADLAALWNRQPTEPAAGSATAAIEPDTTAGAVDPEPAANGSGTMKTPCRCGARRFVESPISEGRTRRDCAGCGRFVEFGRWYEKGADG